MGLLPLATPMAHAPLDVLEEKQCPEGTIGYSQQHLERIHLQGESVVGAGTSWTGAGAPMTSLMSHSSVGLPLIHQLASSQSSVQVRLHQSLGQLPSRFALYFSISLFLPLPSHLPPPSLLYFFFFILSPSDYFASLPTSLFPLSDFSLSLCLSFSLCHSPPLSLTHVLSVTVSLCSPMSLHVSPPFLSLALSFCLCLSPSWCLPLALEPEPSSPGLGQRA